MNNKIIEIFKTFMILFIITILLVCSILYINDVKLAASNSINICLTSVIPSMYGFMIIACFMLKSNLHTIMGKPFKHIARFLFKISPEEFSIFLISVFAGYPVGAKIIYELELNNSISKKHAENLSCYCYSSGPAFIVGTVATTLYGSIKVGIIIFLSIIISNIITGVVIGLFSKEATYFTSRYKTKINLDMNTLVSSVRTAAKSIFEICIMMLMFSVLYAIILRVGIIAYMTKIISQLFNINADISQQIIASFFEISNISNFDANNYTNLPIITGLLSFGGLCVIMQIIAISRGKIKIMKFLLVRSFSAISSAIICKIVADKLFASVIINTYLNTQIKSSEYSVIPSIALLLMTIILLFKKDWTN